MSRASFTVHAVSAIAGRRGKSRCTAVSRSGTCSVQSAHSISDKPRVITEQARQLDLTRYGKTVFGMFSGTPQQVKLRFRNSLAGVVIDRFGKSAMFVPDGESHFTFTTEIVLSPVFYGWLAGFGEQAEIVFPASVREDFADLCRRTLSLYETSREE